MKKIYDLLPQEEILAQLAEEASELSQAALKLRRAMMGVNPTPVPAGDAMDDLAEELADVAVCAMNLLGVELSDIVAMAASKGERWLKRLNREDDNG